MALIEREALKATLKRVKWLSAADGSAAVHLVNVAPTIDPISSQTGVIQKSDVHKLTARDRREIARRVRQGERVEF